MARLSSFWFGGYKHQLSNDRGVDEMKKELESYGLALNEKTLKFLVRCIDINKTSRSPLDHE